jgi:O-antigen ligase
VATGKIRKIGLFHVFLFLFFLWNGISILWSIDVDSTLIQIITFAQMAIFCLMLWDLCTTRPAIRAVLQAYVLGLAILIVSTVADFIASIGTDFALYGRYSASGNNANTTGIYLAMGLPMAWYLAMSAGKGKIMLMLRLVNYVYIPVIMFTIILTATRFAVIMSLPAFLFGLGTLNKLKPISRILIFVFLTAAVVQLSSMIPQASLQRLGTMDDEFQKGDFNDRTELWERGIDIWHDHPILGVGSGGYNEAVAPIYGRPRSVHNSFIAILAELGIIGMGLFGLILVTAIFQAWRHPTILDAWFWLTVLITWGLGNLALTWTYSKPTWLLLSLLAASASLYRQSDMSSPYVEPSYGNTATIPVPLLSTTQAPRDGDQV